ncbi:MAG: L,D-transpeptidase family protein [Helicobacteraceae bacterium]|jgi:murein L,D-transpeptidase YafK|nr:L,D-transpeptidase family protein [Helicobacteraceae bacterium]
MRKVILFAAISAILLADDLADIYRTKGINELEIGINDQLSSKSYWLKKIESLDTKFGFFESGNRTLLVVDKSALTFSIYTYSDGKLQHEGDYKTTIGDAQGDKFKEGDKKTPVGTYRITSALLKDTHNLDPYYGPLALTTNYPNYLDKTLGKSGHGIWVHGFPLNGARNNENSEGCIVIDNDLLLGIYSKADPSQIVVMINENGALEANNDDLAQVLATIFKWRWFWQINDADGYLNLYASDFMRSDLLTRGKFDAIKRSIFAKNNQKKIYFSDLEIVPYPNSIGRIIYRVRLWQDYEAADHRSNRIKELYLRKDDDRFVIVSEH